MLAGIISEFNPFHSGHEYLVKKLKGEYGISAIATVMAGPFVQRGGPALFDPFSRAKAAVMNGVDLAVLLPYVYSGQTAEAFARGGVAILEKMGLEYIAFGAEDIDELAFLKAAEILAEEPEGFKALLKAGLKEGRAFASVRLSALEAYSGMSFSFLKSPNNILALEYLKSIIMIGAKIKPIFIKREIGSPSAEMIRSGWPGSALLLPRKSAEAFIGQPPFPQASLEAAVLASAAAKGPEGLENTAECEPGMAQRAYRAALIAATLEDAVGMLSSKRIAKARARRFFYNSFFGYKKQDLEFFKGYSPGFARVLAMGEGGKAVMKAAKASGMIKLETNIGKARKGFSPEDKKIAAFDQAAWGIWMKFSGRKKPGYLEGPPYFLF